MADFETIRRAGAGTMSDIDEGLRSHMNRVYGIMSLGMLVTAVIAYVVGMDFAAARAGQETSFLSPELLQTMFTSPVRYIIMFAPLAIVFGFGAGINRMSENTARGVFILFSAVMGLSISWIFAIYTGTSIATTFLATAIAFASLSLYGYTTKRDISAWGSFLIMGVIGLIVASLLNIWIGSAGLSFAISLIGILVFAGLTAYDTQNIKNTYIAMASAGQTEWLGKAAIMGALNLYLDFLNMFMFLLNFMGSSE
ncbi:hypothetical protein BFP76_08030 [Amylibacter kogurei]|uniref:SecY protein n=1 Tax=Paramylibacter kogurei TaxID=1889778 RepID=A0A2G5K432_9RHOB|nr:Bax inhibitor-1/YccA family protein [Amylibacter kogurei]PIB23484.1 hypothetical protein BFP76_08030 [Amylibacter kogurei]